MSSFLKTALTFKTALTAALFAGICNSAIALELYSPIDTDVTYATHVVTEDTIQPFSASPKVTTPVKFGVARLDGGRLIALPYGEEEDWTFLNRRLDASFEPISIRGYLNNVPEIPMNGRDSDNKVDEIRLTARDQKLDYVIIYGVDKSKRNAPIAEARMIDIYSGAELGKVTAERDEIEFNIGKLADRVGDMVTLYTNQKA